MLSESLDHGHIAGVAATRDGNPSDATLVMPGVERDPFPVELDLEPCVEIHRRRVSRHSDVAEITVYVACWNIHAAAATFQGASLLRAPLTSFDAELE
jgi:hypothetical protein